VDAPGREEDLLVDCGNLAGTAQVVVPFLHARGLDRLPHLALTHGDVRHVGGAPCLESNLPPARVWTSPIGFRSPTYRDYVGVLGRSPGRHQRVSAGDRLVGWDVLHPVTGEAFSLADDNALVLRRCIGGTRVLLLSDLGSAGEAALLARERDLRADIVVTGLPGRGRPLSLELIEAVQPRLIVVADDEPSGPARASLELRRHLLATGVPTVFTSDEGPVTVRIGREGWGFVCLLGRRGLGTGGRGEGSASFLRAGWAVPRGPGLRLALPAAPELGGGGRTPPRSASVNCYSEWLASGVLPLTGIVTSAQRSRCHR